MVYIDTGQAMKEYASGKFTIKQIAEKYGVSVGKMYYLLRDYGCEFIHKRRKPVSDEERKKRSEAKKGWVMSEAQRKMISERNSCNYDGMNGYGHTKDQNCGYVLVYVPKHPFAHRDGYVMLHTVIMERHIGRYLKPDEVVHHINHDKKDNRIENLRLMTKHDHSSMHMKERYGKKEE